jgi:hypothetical protein
MVNLQPISLPASAAYGLEHDGRVRTSARETPVSRNSAKRLLHCIVSHTVLSTICYETGEPTDGSAGGTINEPCGTGDLIGIA